jgi:thiamine biosynthesis lipoprotein
MCAVLDAAEWTVWSTTARLVVTDAEALPAARAIVVDQLAAIDQACSRFRDDSEIRELERSGGRPVHVSPLLGELLAAALAAARRTNGDVDPTVGTALAELGYDRDLAQVAGVSIRLRSRPVPGWQQVQQRGRWVQVPEGVGLDLGATGKAFAADRCAAMVADRLNVGALVSLGGDIATAGPAPYGGWRIRVQDLPGDPSCTIALPAAAAVATSSTQHREWRNGADVLHHVLNPRTGRPAARVWRSVSVAAGTCVEANTLTTAALVRGQTAIDWLTTLGAPALLVRADGGVVRLGGWPESNS